MPAWDTDESQLTRPGEGGPRSASGNPLGRNPWTRERGKGVCAAAGTRRTRSETLLTHCQLATDLAAGELRRVDVHVRAASRNCLDQIVDRQDADFRAGDERRPARTEVQAEIAGPPGRNREVQHDRPRNSLRADVNVPGGAAGG